MNHEKAKGLAILGMGSIGAVTGCMWAGMLTATEILAVSNPVGALIGAAFFIGIILDADETEVS